MSNKKTQKIRKQEYKKGKKYYKVVSSIKKNR